MKKIKCAVIGVGYLGRFHAQKYHALPNVTLVGVSDVSSATCAAVADELQVQGFSDYRDLFGQVDAVSIAASTSAHYQIAKDCLENGIHCLIEKPITTTSQEAEELLAIAKKHNLKIQVGHLERFNPAHLALFKHLNNPQYIDAHRLAPFTRRGADVNVVLDLMIHDIDIILNLVKSPILKIEAQGASVLSSSLDLASARITFANNCVANLTASRINSNPERITRIFQEESLITLDYHLKKLTIFSKGDGEMFPGVANISKKETEFPNSDALLNQILSFTEAVINDSEPLVSGKDGLEALKTAVQITTKIHDNLNVKYAKS